MAIRISARRPAALDGRARRGERSRESIVAALHALVGEGIVQPTAQQVAERARVGLRSVFRHFDDMDSVYAELGARILAQARPLIADAPTEGSIETRLRRVVALRSAFYEATAPYLRAQEVSRRRSPFLQRQHLRYVRELRERLWTALPELAHAPESVAESLDLVLSFEAWDRLRVDQKLSRERASGVLEGAALALTAGLRARRGKR
ncbi:MAG TPA: TetR/AcrR family transcriptional regulator [Myxococcota bacterium]|nr:TetR/AcrR family transcriptional regulator [Myxococcota bacterium]